MMIVTKHFGFSIERSWFHFLRRWDHLSLRIGFVGEPRREYPRYRYWAGVDVQLLPNFIWYQDVIRQDWRCAQTHTRLIGIQSWPFMRFCGDRP